jgi:hypothetical protein
MEAAVTAVVIDTFARKERVVNLLSINVLGLFPAGRSKYIVWELNWGRVVGAALAAQTKEIPVWATDETLLGWTFTWYERASAGSE